MKVSMFSLLLCMAVLVYSAQAMLVRSSEDLQSLEVRGNHLKKNGCKCSYSTDCKSGNCQYSKCHAKLPNKKQCYKDSNCISNYCNDGICCGKKKPDNHPQPHPVPSTSAAHPTSSASHSATAPVTSPHSSSSTTSAPAHTTTATAPVTPCQPGCAAGSICLTSTPLGNIGVCVISGGTIGGAVCPTNCNTGYVCVKSALGNVGACVLQAPLTGPSNPGSSGNPVCPTPCGTGAVCAPGLNALGAAIGVCVSTNPI